MEERIMGDRLTKDDITTLRSWLADWGPIGQSNWSDKEGNCVPVAKTTMARLIDAAERGVDGFAQDAISYTEAHGVDVGRVYGPVTEK